MKKNVYLSLLLLTLSLSAAAQDWNGRVYQCNQSDDLRMQMVKEMTSDPDFEKMSLQERTMTSQLIGCIDVKMAMKFKKDSKVTTSFYITLNEAKMKQNNIPSILYEPFKEMIRSMQADMKETTDYKFMDGKVIIGDEAFGILDGEKKLTATEDDITLTFIRK